MTETALEKSRAWIELDMDNLKHNVAALRALLPPGCELMPAVKANAYGHGAVPIGKELNRLGVHAFCVATVGEGVELRRQGIQGEILVLGYTHPRQFELLSCYDLTQTAVDFEHAQELNRFGQLLRVHIAVDTGMRRIGERCENFDRICAMFRMEHLVVTGIFTHLCAADSQRAEDRAFTARQAASFRRLLQRLERRGYHPKAHILNSSGLLHHPEYGGAYARVGIALYGVLSGRAELESCPAELRPVLSIRARVALTKRLHPGEGAGYGLAYVADRERAIAVLTIGYADGIPRSLSCGRGKVLIHGQEAPIVGRICMDQMLVDVTDIPQVKSGDEAVVLGQSGAGEITAYDLAEAAGTITNELLSCLGGRLERVIKERC